MSRDDHAWLEDQRVRRSASSLLVCDGPGCQAPVTLLTLWERPWALMCRCEHCCTSPACDLCVSLWRSGGVTQLLSAVTLPDGWRPGDGWPVRPLPSVVTGR